MGYFRAGFDVVGSDIEPQPNYPFEFVKRDILGWDPEDIRKRFDVLALSPPCQRYSITRHLHTSEHPDLVEPARALARAAGLPYIMENVPGAPLIDPITLCGSSFGMPLRRHRLFESNTSLQSPPCDHSWQNRHKPYWAHVSKSRGGTIRSGVVRVHGRQQMSPDGTSFGSEYDHRVGSVAMGIDWMTKEELNNAVPPAYTFYLGRQMLKFLQVL